MNGNHLLTVQEFAKHYGFGLGKARELVNEGLGTYTVFIGKKKHVVQELFEQQIMNQVKHSNQDNQKED